MLRPIVLWIVALILFIITLKNIIVRAVMKKRCTKEVLATVTSIKQKRRTQGSIVGQPGLTSLEYIPTIAYTVDGVEYSARYIKAYVDTDYEVGQTVAIMVNPNKPNEINKNGASNTTDIIMLCVGAVIAIAGVLVMIFQ